LRDVAKPVLEADSHAKVQMRKKVRGLRTIEQTVLERQASLGQGLAPDQGDPSQAVAPAVEQAPSVAPVSSTAGGDAVGGVVLDYCTMVRGLLNDDQGGPLHPPGLRMAKALNEVHDSLQRNLDAKKGGSPRSNSGVWRAASRGVSTKSRSSKR
jgi:hypothetical protein